MPLLVNLYGEICTQKALDDFIVFLFCMVKGLRHVLWVCPYYTRIIRFRAYRCVIKVFLKMLFIMATPLCYALEVFCFFWTVFGSVAPVCKRLLACLKEPFLSALKYGGRNIVPAAYFDWYIRIGKSCRNTVFFRRGLFFIYVFCDILCQKTFGFNRSHSIEVPTITHGKINPNAIKR